jgi:hypothetical protein
MMYNVSSNISTVVTDLETVDRLVRQAVHLTKNGYDVSGAAVDEDALVLRVWTEDTKKAELDLIIDSNLLKDGE